MTEYWVLSVGVLVFAGHLFSALFKRTNIPDVLPLIFIGIILGIYIEPEDAFGEIGHVFLEIALALLLFEGGAHLTLSSIKKSIGRSMSIALVTFFGTVIITTIVLQAFMFSLLPSIFAGILLGSISPAVVIPTVSILDISEQTKTSLIIESAITDVLSIVLALIVINLDFSLPDFKDMSFINLANTVLYTALISAAIGAAGALVWSFILERMRQFPNTIFTSLAFILILHSISNIFHYNGPLTVLIFGLVLANADSMPMRFLKDYGKIHLTEFSNIEKSFFAEIMFLVKVFFFIYLGIAIEFSEIQFIALALILTFLIYVARAFITRFTLSRTTSFNEAKLISFMIPKGLAAAVLSAKAIEDIGGSEVLLNTLYDIQSVIYGVILFSIIFSAYLVYTENNKTSIQVLKKIFKPFQDKNNDTNIFQNPNV